MLVLVTGATGKVGRHFIDRFFSDARRNDAELRAMCHNRTLPERPRLSVRQGSISDRGFVREAMADVTHVVHLATCKETPDDVMDVAVKGLFWLLEEFRESKTARQFILIGGDAGIGHCFVRHPEPVTERTPFAAYPGCYALSKVLEEVMLQQYGVQYDLNWCCLRAPWIMEKDDFKYALAFGAEQFGGPDWRTLMPEATVEQCRRDGLVPVLHDAEDRPLRRNFVHVDDLASAILLALDHPKARQQLFNICMDEPVDYGAVAGHLRDTRGQRSIEVKSGFFSNWMDNSKAKAALGWRPRYDLKALIDSAWSYARPANEPRRVWYPG
jgi:nucleoside-diphosphate-sugar epimerase